MSTALANNACAAQSVGSFNTLVGTLLQALLTAQCSVSAPDIWPKDYADTALQRGVDDSDFVIIGGGTTGSVMASRLSENPDWKVLVLEAGGDPPQESEIPALMSSVRHTEYNWNYLTEPNGKSCLGSEKESCYLSRGKTIGGSSATNAMLYLRGNRGNYEEWVKRGNAKWGWDDVLPYFEKSVQPVGNASHPLGYVTISQYPRLYPDIQDIIYAGAAQLGFPHVQEFGEGSEIGYSNVPGTLENGLRTSPGKGHLSRVAASRPNLRVVKNTQVTKINFDASGKKVESVSVLLKGEQLEVKVCKELVLSAGSIESPKLLMLSGIGHEEHLNSRKVPLLHKLPIGDNLQDHVVVPVFIKLNENRTSSLQEQDTLDHLHNYMIHSKGPLSGLTTVDLTALIKTKLIGSTYPDIENHYLVYKRGDFAGLNGLIKSQSFKEELMAQPLEALKTADLLVVFVFLLEPKSVGTVRLRSDNYADAAKISPNYLKESADVGTLANGIRHLMKLEGTAAFRNNAAQIIRIDIEECTETSLRTEKYLRCYAKYMSTTVNRFVGTIKMGPEWDKTSCVNQELQLHGVSNLRVVDASVMPTITSGNIHVDSLMIAERAADFVKTTWA